MAYPRYRRSRVHKLQRYTAGDILFDPGTTVWTPLAELPALTLKEAQVGDTVVFAMNMLWGAQVGTAYADAFSLVGGTPARSWGTGEALDDTDFGIYNLRWNTAPTHTDPPYGPVSCWVPKVLEAADIENDSVTIRPYFRMSLDSESKTIFGNSKGGIHWSIENIGPAQS